MKMSAKREYIESVDGMAHQSAVEIIEKFEVENQALKAENHQVNVRLSNYQGDLADIIISLEDENKALAAALRECRAEIKLLDNGDLTNQNG